MPKVNPPDYVDSIKKGLVSEKISSDGLRLLKYTEDCKNSRTWNDTTLQARGHVVSSDGQIFLCRPFDKFFNDVEPESAEIISGVPIRVMEKLDGTLINVWTDQDHKLRVTTTGSFDNEYISLARELLRANMTDLMFMTGCTYMFELRYPNGMMPSDSICPYEGPPKLTLLNARYNRTGAYSPTEVLRVGLYMPTVPGVVANKTSLSEFQALKSELSPMYEGWVLDYGSGRFVKVKGDAWFTASKACGMSDKQFCKLWAEGGLDEMRDKLHKDLRSKMDRPILAKLESSLLQAKDLYEVYRNAAVGLSQRELYEYAMRLNPAQGGLFKKMYNKSKNSDCAELRELVAETVYTERA